MNDQFIAGEMMRFQVSGLNTAAIMMKRSEISIRHSLTGAETVLAGSMGELAAAARSAKAARAAEAYVLPNDLRELYQIEREVLRKLAQPRGNENFYMEFYVNLLKRIRDKIAAFPR